MIFAISFNILPNLVYTPGGRYKLMVRFDRFLGRLMLCSPLALAACQTSAPAVVATAPKVSPNAPDVGGIYKIGTPYQIEGLWYYPAEDYAYAQEGTASWYGTDFHGKRTANGDRYNMNDMTAAHPTLPMPSVVKVTNLANGKQIKVTVNDRGPFHSNRIIDLSKKAAQELGFYEKGTTRVRVEIDATESLQLKNLAMAKRPPEMPAVVASPRGAVLASSLEPLGPSVPVPSRAVQPVVAPTTLPAAKPAIKPEAKPAPKPAAKVATLGGIFVQAGAFAEEANARKLEQQLGELGTVHIIPTTVNSKKLYRVRLGPVADAATANVLVGKIKAYGYNDVKVVRE